MRMKYLKKLISDDELCEKLINIKQRYAIPRKTKIIDAE